LFYIYIYIYIYITGCKGLKCFRRCSLKMAIDGRNM